MKFIQHLFAFVLLTMEIHGQNVPPAYEAAKHFLHGVNIANFLEVPPGEHWAVKHTRQDLEQIKAEGFDHIRLPVGWHNHLGAAPAFSVADDVYAGADEMITNATGLGLAVIIDFHHFDAFMKEPQSNRTAFVAIWRQVAQHYALAPDTVAFELLNEPNDKASTVVMNPIYAEAIQAIRETNPKRTIFVGPGKWNSPDELMDFTLPPDENLIVTLHCYDPMMFTHQGASWAGPDLKSVRGVQFPGPPITPLAAKADEHAKWVVDWIERYNIRPTEKNPSGTNAFSAKIQKAKAWSEQFKRPVHFGEFGAYTKADQTSRAHYYAAMRKELEAAGFGWAIWDWKSGFNYWDVQNQKPLPGMHEALFGTK